MEVDSTEHSEPCPPALKALLHHLIDYAGIFPPAQLPLDRALRNFSRYRQEQHNWMLGRFVLPTSRLDELDAFSGLYRDDPPFKLSVLGAKNAKIDVFKAEFPEEVNLIQELHERHNDRVSADVMEVPLPGSLLGAGRSEIGKFLDEIYRTLVTNGLSKLDIFFEVPVDNSTTTQLPAVLDALRESNEKHETPLRMELGCKFRLGGEGPDAVPSAAHLAEAIYLCRKKSVRFKATAGLHHPLRHEDTETERYMHGFFNVFGAACLAHAEDVPVEVLEAILLDETADNFRFDNRAFHWESFDIPIDAIVDTRQEFAISFGSCSFDEPREDLQELSLL